jgi:hypothetical protein
MTNNYDIPGVERLQDVLEAQEGCSVFDYLIEMPMDHGVAIS